MTTVEPGLMRTGSHLNAQFVGDQGAEFAWFSAADNIPLLSMDADRAAAQIVGAVLAGRAVVQPTPLAKVAQRVDALAPNATALLLGAVDPAAARRTDRRRRTRRSPATRPRTGCSPRPGARWTGSPRSAAARPVA